MPKAAALFSGSSDWCGPAFPARLGDCCSDSERAHRCLPLPARELAELPGRSALLVLPVERDEQSLGEAQGPEGLAPVERLPVQELVRVSRSLLERLHAEEAEGARGLEPGLEGLAPLREARARGEVLHAA